MTWLDALLSGIIGAIGFLVAYLFKRVGSAAYIHVRHRNAFERVVVLAQQLVRAKSEVVLIEIELAKEVDEINDTTRFRFVQWAKDMSDALPPLLIQQLRRFGLAEPPPDVPVASSSTIPSSTPEPAIEPAQTVANAWSEEP